MFHIEYESILAKPVRQPIRGHPKEARQRVVVREKTFWGESDADSMQVAHVIQNPFAGSEDSERKRQGRPFRASVHESLELLEFGHGRMLATAHRSELTKITFVDDKHIKKLHVCNSVTARGDMAAVKRERDGRRAVVFW
jgi:hypothetical protein